MAQNIIGTLKNKILPYLLSVILSASLFGVFLERQSDVWYFSLLAGILCAVYFAVYEMMNRHRVVGIPIFGVLTVIIFTAEYMVTGGMRSAGEMAEWFISGGNAVETQTSFLYATLIGFTFFFSSAAFYFTNVIYRSSVILIISLIPCAVYVKAAATISVGFAAAIAVLNMFIFIAAGRSELEKKATVIGKMSAATAYVDFAVAAALIAVLIPKPSETPFYEKFENFISAYSIGGQYSQAAGTFNEYSGNADNYQKMESKLLYVVNTNRHEYFKIQTFDIYHSDTGRWESYNKDGKGFKNWQNTRTAMSYSKLLEVYNEVNCDILDNCDKSALNALKSTDDELVDAKVRTVEFSAVYAIAPNRVTDIDFSIFDVGKTYRTAMGEIFTDLRFLDENVTYDMTYYPEDYIKTGGWIKAGLCNISMDDYGRLLNDLQNDQTLKKNAELYSTAVAFNAEFNEAQQLTPSNYDNVSVAIANLAAEITKDCTYDWEKAQALENYFQSGEFTYDLAYQAPVNNDTPEYFLTTSKRGTCSDFATAYCLMARASGLTVRYVEGFVPKATSRTGTFQIFTENAHAYPEVFIAGAGWTIYEPTVAADSEGNGENADAAAETDFLTIFLTCLVILVCVVALTLILIFIPVWIELVFIIRFKLADNTTGVILLYNRYLRRLKKLFKLNTKVMNCDQIEAFTAEKTGISCEMLTKTFADCCYGGIKADKKQKYQAYVCYDEQIRLLKKYKKGMKKKK